MDRETDTGLCSTCEHARKITSARGSAFILCALSEVNPAFPRYPRLPVKQCDGYVPVDAAGDAIIERSE